MQALLTGGSTFALSAVATSMGGGGLGAGYKAEGGEFEGGGGGAFDAAVRRSLDLFVATDESFAHCSRREPSSLLPELPPRPTSL